MYAEGPHGDFHTEAALSLLSDGTKGEAGNMVRREEKGRGWASPVWKARE